jgi:hypothetical protein
MNRIKLLILLVMTSFSSFAAFTPVTITGFNEDVIANGSGSAASSVSANISANGFDGGGYVFVAQNYTGGSGTPTYYLPNGGLVSSLVTPGLTFQLASYSANNALEIATLLGNTTGTLTFTTPRTAGALFLVGTAGNGPATFTATVNFSNSTSQTFTGLSFPDWYSGTASVNGIGRASVTDNHFEGSSTTPHLSEIPLVLSTANWALTITSITITKTGTTGQLAIFGVSAEDVCSGTPATGSITASSYGGCPSSYTSNLSFSGSAAGTIGIYYQWQSSPDSLNWTNISGATNTTYAATVTANTYYRVKDSCGVSLLTNVTAGLLLPYTSQPYASIPFAESFETAWMSCASTDDRPNQYWTNLNPASGNNSWRRDDDGGSAGWSSPTVAHSWCLFSRSKCG